MQNYTTIIGVVELRLQDVGYATIQSRYNIGSSTVTLIMKRYRELGIPLETLYGMSPKSVELVMALSLTITLLHFRLRIGFRFGPLSLCGIL